MKAKECEEHRILRINASNSQCDIECPYCRIAELEQALKYIVAYVEDPRSAHFDIDEVLPICGGKTEVK